MEDAARRWHATCDTAIQALADERFEDAAHAHTLALDHAERIEQDPDHAATSLRDLIALHERQIDRLRAGQFATFRQLMATRESSDEARVQARERARTIRQHYCQQLDLYQRLLDLQERTLGPESLALADTLLAMASIYWREFNEFKSFPFEERALAIRERALGPDHPAALEIVSSLARGYSTLITYEKAAPHWRRILDAIDRGINTPQGIWASPLHGVLHELGTAYNALAAHAEAEAIWLRVLALPEIARTRYSMMDSPRKSPDHAINAILLALYSAGQARSALGRWAAAEPLLAETLAIHQRFPSYLVNEGEGTRQLGLDASLHSYATALQHLGRPSEALPLFEESLAINRQRGLRLVALLRDLDRAAEGVVLEERAAAVETEVKTRRARFRPPPTNAPEVP